MPSEKVVDALSRLGVDVPDNYFGHYGVKGMKWNKNKTPEQIEAEAQAARDRVEAAGGSSMDQDFAEAAARGIPIRNAKDDRAFGDSRESSRTNGRLSEVRRVKGNSEMRRFVDKLFDSKVQVRGNVTKVRQGVLNKFIEKTFKKVTGK